MYNQGYPPSNYPLQRNYTSSNYPSQPGAPYPPQGSYPPSTYPPQGNYPPQAYPPQNNYSTSAYPPQGMGAYPREPMYRQITVGRGIDMNEYNAIVGVVKQTYMTGQQPMANTAAENIRREIGGDWFVFISDVGIEDYDFSMTRVKGGDFIAFSLDNKKFQVCRIR